jgi:hypothetical protein
MGNESKPTSEGVVKTARKDVLRTGAKQGSEDDPEAELPNAGQGDSKGEAVLSLAAMEQALLPHSGLGTLVQKRGANRGSAHSGSQDPDHSMSLGSQEPPPGGILTSGA